MDEVISSLPRKGRGAVSNPTGRFESAQRYATDDGWGAADAPLPRLATSVSVDASRRIITRNQSPDIPFDQSINPYRGCEHGCVYCYARPTHAWLGLSPGLDFESRLFRKPDAARLLEAELRDPKYRCKVIAIGTNTDPYQPIERGERITRQILEVLSAFNHPVGIVTKSALVLRDIDILADMAKRNLASVFVSVTTFDRDLARRMEPRAAAPGRRLEVIRALSEAGIPTGVLAAPMIPALNDTELETILTRAHEAGASSAGYVLLRLPYEIKQLFAEWLETHVPDRATRVLNRVRETQGGKLYESCFGQRMRGSGQYAELIGKRYDLACRRLGLNRKKWDLDTSRFSPPPATEGQLALF
ncbi:MAG: PA0069 family radical SAM protein [Alphaproteobacteria bacterium]|nr:PA0069 family radical SAM protein [Alphaproteobacteria bacterium]